MLNKQIQLAVEKGEMLPLMEEFYTIQGEGFHTGTAAYFNNAYWQILLLQPRIPTNSKSHHRFAPTELPRFIELLNNDPVSFVRL